MEENLVYLDYAATTPVLPSVRQAMNLIIETVWGNPDSPHKIGRKAAQYVNVYRRNMQDLLGIKEGDLLFVGSGSEANNLAIQGWLRKNYQQEKALCVSATSHHSTLNSLILAKERGFNSYLIPVNSYGELSTESLRQFLLSRPHMPFLVCVEWVNNETGFVNPIKSIVQLVHQWGGLVLVDAVQALPHLKINLQEIGADFVSFAAHKIGGPKGIGALYVRDLTTIDSLILGGAQESGLRAGTLDVPAIAGFYMALLISQQNNSDTIKQAEYHERIKGFRELLRAKGYKITIPDELGVDGITHLTLDMESSFVATMLSSLGVCVSTGAACSGAEENSHVLRAMGIDGTHGLRISYNCDCALEDLDFFVKKLQEVTHAYDN